jgi:hypothetical protein
MMTETWAKIFWLTVIFGALLSVLLLPAPDAAADPSNCFAQMTCDPNTVIYCPDGRLITIYGACPQLITGPEGPTLPGGSR